MHVSIQVPFSQTAILVWLQTLTSYFRFISSSGVVLGQLVVIRIRHLSGVNLYGFQD